MVRGRGGRSAPSLITRFNTEKMITPASSPQGYYFRWDDNLEAYDLSSYNSEYSDHQINEQMIVNFFKDVHAIPLHDPKKTNVLHWLNVFSMIAGIVAGGLFILLGYSREIPINYEVIQNTRYKAVVEMKSTSHLIYTPMVGMAHFLLGFLSFMFINIFRIEKMRIGRFTKRIQQIKEVFERHKEVTFSGLQVSLQVGSLGAYVGLRFDWKQAAFIQGPAGMMMQMGYNAPTMAFNVPPGFALG